MVFRHKRWLIVGAGLALGLALLFKRRTAAPPLPYQLPSATGTSTTSTSNKFDEYEAALSGKKAGRLQQQTQPGTFALWQRLQAPPPPPPKPTTKAAPTSTAPRQGFFSYQGERRAALPATLLLTARLYQAHRLHDGDGIAVRLEEATEDLPKGALLFGVAHFAKNRLLIRFTTAQHQERRWPIHCIAYDQDFLPGIAYPGLEPSPIDRPTDRLVGKAIGSTEAGVLREVGRGAMDAWKTLRKKKTAILEDGRLLYVEPKSPKKR